MSAERTVSLRYQVAPSFLARAMALEARDTLGLYARPFCGEDPRLAEYVRSMSRASAVRALRSALRSYGELSWPDDYPHEAYRAGLAMAREWGYA